MNSPSQINVLQSARKWWDRAASVEGPVRATQRLCGILWEFARDSTPERLRARYGDADYDWDYRVNTTSGAVGWRDRLIGMFHSSYQPTEPAAFREMIHMIAKYLGRIWLIPVSIDLILEKICAITCKQSTIW